MFIFWQFGGNQCKTIAERTERNTLSCNSMKRETVNYYQFDSLPIDFQPSSHSNQFKNEFHQFSLLFFFLSNQTVKQQQPSGTM